MDSTPSLQVKGGSLRSKLLFVRENFGEAAEQELQDLLVSLGIPQVLEANWYPYSLFEHLLREIAERHLGGDISRLQGIGRYSASKSLTSTYAIYLQRGDFARFLEKLPTLHSRYYDTSHLTIETVDDAAGLVELKVESPELLAAEDLYVAAGFYQGAAELMGRQRVHCEFEREHDGVRFRLTWATD